MNKKAKRSDIEIQEMPEQQDALDIKRKFTEEDMEKIKMGFIPQSTDDKWFIFYEDDILYFQRTLSGFCIYKVKFEKRRNKYQISEAKVNSDPHQYERMPDELEKRILKSMVDGLTL